MSPRKPKHNAPTAAAWVAESPDPLTQGGQYTITGGNLVASGVNVNVVVQDSVGLQAYTAGIDADGNLTPISGYASWTGDYLVEVWDIDANGGHTVLASTTFTVVAP